MIRVSLFTSSFSWKKAGSILLIPIFIILLALSNHVMTYFLVDDVDSYTRITLHELHHEEANIDVLFLGSSHTYRSLDPSITDEIFQANTFNAGTSSQMYDGSYAMLREAGRDNKLKKVYMEMYFAISGKSVKERTELTSTYIIGDYLNPSVDKALYLTNASDKKYWINNFIPARRYWRNLFEPEYVRSVFEAKRTETYRDYSYVDHGEEYYAGKGYVANKGTVTDEGFSSDVLNPIAKDRFTEDDIDSLEKIINYCKKNGIELTFFSAPIPDYHLVARGNYDEYIAQVKALLEPYGVEYYDFNLMKPEYFSYEGSLFKEISHLNMYGAQAFSNVFSRFFMGQIDAGDLFYDSYQEKIEKQAPKTYGLICTSTEDGNGNTLLQFKPVSTYEPPVYVSMEKRIGDHVEPICEMEELSDVALQKNEEGTLLIRVYSDSSGSAVTNKIEIPY